MQIRYKFGARATVAACLALACAFSASPAAACTIGGPALKTEELDADTRQVLNSLDELFEAEVLKIAGSESEMRVTRVFRGHLKQGAILKGQPISNSCMKRDLRPGDRGFALVKFGSRGPMFVSSFLDSDRVASLRRVGALPSK